MASDEIQNKFFKDVLILEKEFTDVENELFEATAELRKLTVEREQAEPERWRNFDTSMVGLNQRDQGGV